MEIQKAENILFEEWKDKRPNLVRDGLVCKDDYLSNSIKVLYILKEANGGNTWDLRKFLRNGGHWRTWNNIVRWQFGFENDNSIQRFNEVNNVSNEIRKKYLRKIAVINLKKVSGGKSSIPSQILKYSKEDKEYLKKQIKLYKPNIIICCGTGKIVNDIQIVEGIKEWKKTSNGIWYSTNEKLIIIGYYHPQQRRIKKETLYKNLVFGYNEIQNSIHKTV